jgi:hypothetical protein
MSLFNQLQRFFRNATRKSSRGSKSGQPRRKFNRFTLEWLEDRLVPTATWYVNAAAVGFQDGSQAHPFATIQQGVNAANPAGGDIVQVAAGTYTGIISLDRPLTLDGANAGIHPAVGTSTTETVGARGTESILSLGFGGLQINADGVTVDGFTIQDASSSNANGLIAPGASSNNFILTNTILNDDNAPFGAPILYQGGSHTHNVFSFDLFQDNGDSTFYLASNSPGDVYTGFDISFSKLAGTAGGVFYAENSGGKPLTSAVIQGNEFDGTIGGTPGLGDPALNIGNAVNLTIQNNYFHDMQYTAFQVGMVGGSITGNTFARISASPTPGFGDDFQLWGGQFGTAVSTNVTIANNLISFNDVPGATNPTRGIRLRPQDTGSSAPGIDGTTIHIHDNAFINGGVLPGTTTNLYAVVDQGDSTKPVDASGNWWDTSLGSSPTVTTDAQLNQITALFSGPAHVGAFLNSGANSASVLPLFSGVPLGFVPAATTEMWVPRTAATTGNTVVNGTIQDGINTAFSAMTVRVAADTYAENDTITKPLTLFGANAGVDPNTAARGAETVITTAVKDPTNDALPVLEVTGGGSHVTIDGFTLDGINPNLGSSIQSSTGVLFNLVSHVTYQNNIAENFLHFGISGVGDDGSNTAASADDLVQNSLFKNMPGEVGVGYGEGVDAANNFYVSVKDNVFQAVRRGMQFGNFYGANPDPGTPAVISGNQIDAGQIGIWINNFYESAQGITIESNTLNSTFVASVISPPSPDANRAGLFFSSLTFGGGHTVGDFTVSNNTIEGMYDQGILFWNNSKSVTISGGTIDGSAFLNRQVGVRYEDQNPYYGDTHAADSGGVLTLSGVTITNAPTGIQVAGNLPVSDHILLPVVVTAGTSISGGSTGIVVSGANAGLSFYGTIAASLSGQGGNYITLASGADGGGTIDASGVTFNGKGGPNPGTTLSQFFGIEDRITDYLDDPKVGYVSINAGNVYAAHSSETANPGAVQRGVDAALAGNIVNLQAGTYVANGSNSVSGSAVGVGGQEVAGLTIDKPLTLLGPNPTYDPNSALTPANGQAIIVPGASDPNPYDPNAVIVMLISSSNVTVQGITVDGINPNLTHYFDPGTASGHIGYVTAYGSAAPLDAAEDIASYADVSNVTLQNNLIQNAGYLAVDFFNGTDYSGAATTGSLITSNLIQNASDAYFYGDGVNLYNNFYADVTHNVIQSVRTGVQLGNYSQANPNANPALCANVASNTVSADRIGLWYNLFYENSSPFTFANNTISALRLAGNSKWDGVFISSVQESSSGTFQGNTIDGTNADPSKPSEGYDVWNTPTTGQLLIYGGSVTGVDYGVWVNTYEAFNSAANNTQVTVSGLDITASQIGVYVEESPLNTTGATATATIDSARITTAGSGIGVKVFGATASAAITDSTITGNATGIVVEGGGSLTARNNFIFGSSGPALLVGGSGTLSVTIQDNDLSNNGSTVVQNTNSGTTVDAIENYWGPTHVAPAAVAGLVSGKVNFEPILTTGDESPSTPGFQPDTTSLAVDISSGTTSPTQGASYTLNLAPSNPSANNAAITQWVISWGDGTPKTTVSSPNILAAVTHVYGKAGTYTITATATDELGNTASSNSVPAIVGDLPLSSSPSDLTPPTATEGAAFGPVTVFHFTDADPNGQASDYVATVQTGDATLTSTANPSAVTIVPDAVNGGFDVQLSYIYLEELQNATFSVLVTDHDATTSQSTGTFSVADAALTNVLAVNSNTALEGKALTVLLATFTDPAGPEATGNYTADINWGDGTGNQPSSGTITYNSTTGNFEVWGTHTYAEESGADHSGFNYYQVTIRLHHGSATDLAAVTAQVTVQDLAVIAQQGQSQVNAVEGGDTNLVILARFTDPAGAESVADYSATVDWGDNTTPDNTFDVNANIFIVQAGSTFLVEGSHIYTKESPVGGYTITTTIHHETAPDVVTSTLRAFVSDPAVSATGGFTFSAVEGALPNAPETVATFTDPAGAELLGSNPAPGEYSATINWGDGSAATSGTISYSAGTFTVQGNHQYSQDGKYSISVLLQHGAAPNVSVASTAVVSDPSVVLNGPALLSFAATEGTPSALQRVATFTDPGGPESMNNYSATINWGDGTPVSAGTITYSGGTFTVWGSHAYAEESGTTGPSITVTVSHGSAADASGITASATVADAPLSGTLAALSPTEGAELSHVVLYHFTDADPNGIATDYKATVQWDTGGVEDSVSDPADVQIVANSGGGFDVVGSHTYAAYGSVALRVTVTDHNATISSSATVNVADAALTITSLTPPASAVAGTPFSGAVATFTDADPNGTASDYTVTIAWGDGTVDTVTGAGGGITQSGETFTVYGAHTYGAEGATRTPFTVTVTDDTATASQSAGVVPVTDAAVTIASFTPPAHVTEGSLFTGSVATFTDADPNGTAAEFTATISWGDGRVDTVTSSGGGITESDGTFTVHGSHTYTEDGSKLFSVSIVDVGGAHTSASGPATVDEALVSTTNGQTVTTVQGQFLANVLVATFSDGSQGTDSDLMASVAWGDGETSPGTVTFNATTHLYEARASKPNPYGTAGTVGITVTISDDGNVAATVSSSAAVLLAQDSFGRGPSSALGLLWTNQVGSFAINSANQAATTGTGVNFSTYSGSTARNVSVQADFTLPTGAASSAGVVARYTPAGNGAMYLARVRSTGGAHPVYTAEIYLVSAGAATPLGTPTRLSNFSGTGTLRFEVVGNSLKLFVNGVLQVAVYNSTIANAGLVGMRGVNCTLDNFAASVVPSVPARLPYTDGLTGTNGELDRVWTEQAGAFVAQNNTASPFGTGLALATLNTAPAADVRVKANITVNATSGSTAGLVARYSGTPDSNEYLGQIMFTSSSNGVSTYTARVFLFKNGVPTLLGSRIVNVTGPLTGQLEFDVVGSGLTLSLNGTGLVSTTDASLATGLVGMRGRNAAFANFEVQ